MKNFKGLQKYAQGAMVNTEDFMQSSQADTSMMEWPGRPKRKKLPKKRRIANPGKCTYKGCL
jgi:hypothetical protein